LKDVKKHLPRAFCCQKLAETSWVVFSGHEMMISGMSVNETATKMSEYFIKRLFDEIGICITAGSWLVRHLPGPLTEEEEIIFHSLW
jgi:hypothetical protein